MKTCTKCSEAKPLDEYHRSKVNKGGRKMQCKSCISAQMTEYSARPEVKARKAEYNARPEVKAQRADYMTEYNSRPEVKASQAEYMTDYYIENRDRFPTRAAEYYQAKPEVQWEANFRYRSTAYGFTPRVVSFTREALHERWGTACYHCGSEDGTTLDHWPQPVSRGGEHSLSNCRPSCLSCQQYSWREGYTH